MKNYEKQKRQQYETHKKLNRRGKKVLGMLAASLMIGGYAYSSNDASTHNIKYDSRFKMQSNEGLVGTGMDLNRLEKISSNGGTIELDDGESIRATIGHYNMEKGSGNHTAIATTKEKVKLHLSGDVYRYGNQIVAENSNLKDTTNNESLVVENKYGSHIVLDNFDNDFKADKQQ